MQLPPFPSSRSTATQRNFFLLRCLVPLPLPTKEADRPIAMVFKSSQIILASIAIALVSTLPLVASFSPAPHRTSATVHLRIGRHSSLNSAAPSDTDTSSSIPPSVESASERVEACKRELIQQCDNHELGSGYSSSIEGKIKDLEQLGEDAGFGQASSLSGLISGEW